MGTHSPTDWGGKAGPKRNRIEIEREGGREGECNRERERDALSLMKGCEGVMV